MVIIERKEGQTIPWSLKKEQKNIQYHGHNRKNRRTDNSMVILERPEGQTIPRS